MWLTNIFFNIELCFILYKLEEDDIFEHFNVFKSKHDSCLTYNLPCSSASKITLIIKILILFV